MKLRELFDSATAGLRDGRDHLILKLPGRRTPRTERVRIAGPGSPLARVVGTYDDGTLIVDVRASDIVDWCARLVLDQEET